MHTCIRAYIHAYIHTYMHTYIRTYIHRQQIPGEKINKQFSYKEEKICHSYNKYK